MKFVNKFHSNSILPFSICRIKSGSVIQTKHFDIKMSLEIRQAKSFPYAFGLCFLHLFIFYFSILRITINCNYLFTKHFKYKTLIYLCQRPPPEKFVVFYLYKRWVGGGMVIRCCRYFLGCGGICMVGIFDIADAFFDAVVSAWLGYLISQMLFRCGGICKSGVFDIADAFF